MRFYVILYNQLSKLPYLPGKYVDTSKMNSFNEFTLKNLIKHILSDYIKYIDLISIVDVYMHMYIHNIHSIIH